MLGFTASLPGGIDANIVDGVLTFSGTASVATYQQLLQSVTLTSTTPGLRAVSFTVTDADNNESDVLATTVVTVLGLPTAADPLVLTSLVSVNYTAGAAGATVDPGLLVLDADSEIITGATVTIVSPGADDTLSFGPTPEGDGDLQRRGAHLRRRCLRRRLPGAPTVGDVLDRLVSAGRNSDHHVHRDR